MFPQLRNNIQKAEEDCRVFSYAADGMPIANSGADIV
jgi:hypothetical protein